MSALEVTWSDDWDVVQLADGDGDGDGDGDRVSSPPDSLGSIANLWFFTPATSKASRFELQLQCRVASKDARVTIRCSARYVEAFVLSSGAEAHYVATSKGTALPAAEDASPLYAHDVLVPASSAARALQLRFVSLATVAPPAAFAAAEPSVAARAADFQLLQIARLDVAGVAAAAAQSSGAAPPSPSPSPSLTATAAALTGGAPDAARLAALMAMGPPPAAAPGGRAPEGGMMMAMLASMLAPPATAPATRPAAAPSQPAAAPAPPTGASTAAAQQMALLQSLQTMQTQLLTQLSREIARAVEPLHGRLQRLEDKLDALSRVVGAAHESAPSDAELGALQRRVASEAAALAALATAAEAPL